MKFHAPFHLILGAALALATPSAGLAQPAELEFYFPVSVGGAAAATIEGLVDRYTAENPDVRIRATYTGDYGETRTRAIASARGGNPPQIAILLAADRFMLLDEDIILPWDDFVTAEESESWLGGFEEAFMRDSRVDGVTWGIPFQRSTPVLYWNKEIFADVGLDPETPPATWAEMVEMGEKLTVRDGAGHVTRWGVRIPTSGNPWIFTGVIAAAGGEVVNDAGTEVYIDTPEALAALEYLVGLSQEHGIMAPGVIDWGATPRAFMDGENAITWTTTGNLTNIREGAAFEFGVGELPAHERRCSVTGGGNIYLFDGSTEAQTRAAVDFVRWITSAEQAAEWSIATGYVAPRPDAWETEAMRAYVEEVPQAVVAREQLECAIAELATFDVAQVWQVIRDNLHAALTLEKTPAEALADAQAEADRILALYN